MLEPDRKLLQHVMDLDVQIFDTDCFGVMWHGAYIKWLEMGRVRLLEQHGVLLSKPDDANGYIYPVVEQNLRYKAPAKYQDKLMLMTSLEINPPRLIFHQSVYNKTLEKVCLEAETHNMVLDANWKVQRRIPEAILNKLQQH